MSGDLSKVLVAARSKLGYHEDPPGSNHNIFSGFWHKPNEPWCADFATWALHEGGALDVPQCSYTPTLHQEYVNAHRAGSSPRVGALVFFQWPGSSRIDHVGIVEAIKDSTHIITLEGNTTTQAAGSQQNGGEVARKVRSTSLVAGYGYPMYAAGSHPTVPSGGAGKTYPTLQRGSTGEGVRRLEHLFRIPVDPPGHGMFGPQCEHAVLSWKQRHNFAPINGIADPAFLKKIGW